MKVAVIGAGNVGVAIAADLSIKGHEVDLIKTSQVRSDVFDRIISNNNRVYLKEDGEYTKTKISSVSHELSNVTETDVIFITIQSTYHQRLIEQLSRYLNRNQIVVCICSYMSSFYFTAFCNFKPTVVETTGPYLEGRVEMEDKLNEVVFRVGCRLTRSPLSISSDKSFQPTMDKLHELYAGFSLEYSVLESALLNPNMVLHTVGAIMSIPRIEYSHGNFCMYCEAYARGNEATINIMLQLDEEKKNIIKALCGTPVDIFDAGGFLGNPLESFYSYSESPDRAISPTSVHSRYITEDVSQGLVLLESIGKHIGVKTPITTALIDIASGALKYDFRENGRTIYKLGAVEYIDSLT